MQRSGIDFGASAQPPVEEALTIEASPSVAEDTTPADISVTAEEFAAPAAEPEAPAASAEPAEAAAEAERQLDA
jgi:hypothetical protein